MAERRYRLDRLIARGGMAEVWEATACHDGDRSVALKRMRPGLVGHASTRRMFLDEASIASRMDHPGIVRVLDYGMADGAEFIVMELVDGLDAKEACRIAEQLGRPLEEGVAFHVVRCVAEALAHAHAQCDDDGAPLGIVHRDVNPPNVMISRQGEVKLSDFGIAHAQERHERTTTGIIKGKVAFLAPEQVTGGEITAATDVYSVGVTLHSLVAGAPPLSTWRDVSERFQGGALPLSEDLSPGTATVVRNCMEMDPSARPTMAEVARISGDEAVRLCGGEDPGDALGRWLAPILAARAGRHGLDDLLDITQVYAETERHEFVVEESR